MTLHELQAMIKEEFSHYVNEQPGGMPPAGPGMAPPAPGAPGVDVAPGDIDAMEAPAGGPDGAEGQLQKIFGMLKSYFEGGEEGMEEPDLDMTNTDDMGDMDDMGGDDDMPTDVEVDSEEEEEELPVAENNNQLHEGFKSRMQKLANIRK
tara:strand:+ start:874 stop:1323 length:450 start_codon:yes stop_codon:yes gene_type:complete